MQLKGTTNLYRGVQLPIEEIPQYQIGQILSLTGYTSTSKRLSVAQHFAVTDLPSDKCAVVYQIQFMGDEGLFYLSGNYTAYNEEEVLIQDGLDYTIIDIQEYTAQITGQKITKVKLAYPPR